MANFLEARVEEKAKRIKAFIEEVCEERDIELDEIKIYTCYSLGSIVVYLEDGSSYDLGRISYLVKSKWPEIEVIEPETNYEIEFKFDIP